MTIRVAKPGVTYRRCQWCGEDFADYQENPTTRMRPDSRDRARGNALVAFSGEKPEGQEGLMDRGHFIQDLMRANADPHHPAHFLTQLLWNGSEWFRPATSALIRIKRFCLCGRCLSED